MPDMSQAPSGIGLYPGRSYLLNAPELFIAKIIGEFSLFDTITLDAMEADVKTVRSMIAQAQLLGSSGKRLLLIKKAHCLSDIAQNTILKLLEEPPLALVVVVQTEHSSRLLPTVISRLHLLPPISGQMSVGESIFQQGNEKVLSMLSELPRSEIIDVLSEEIIHQRQALLDLPSLIQAKRVELLDLAVKKLNANTNLKLTVDWLLLRWDEF